jgi:hypothetical protein
MIVVLFGEKIPGEQISFPTFGEQACLLVVIVRRKRNGDGFSSDLLARNPLR